MFFKSRSPLRLDCAHTWGRYVHMHWHDSHPASWFHAQRVGGSQCQQTQRCANKGGGGEDCHQENTDVNNARYKIYNTSAFARFVMKKMHSTHLLDLENTHQCVDSPECKHNFYLFTRKLSTFNCHTTSWGSKTTVQTSKSCQMTNVSPIFTLTLALFWPPPTPEGIIQLFICSMFHYVHKPIANFTNQNIYLKDIKLFCRAKRKLWSKAISLFHITLCHLIHSKIFSSAALSLDNYN